MVYLASVVFLDVTHSVQNEQMLKRFAQDLHNLPPQCFLSLEISFKTQ